MLIRTLIRPVFKCKSYVYVSLSWGAAAPQTPRGGGLPPPRPSATGGLRPTDPSDPLGALWVTGTNEKSIYIHSYIYI